MNFSVIGTDIQTNEKIELLKAVRPQSLVIHGSTGTGKSGLIENLAAEDAKQDIGFCLIDIKRTLTDRVLSRIPDEEREKKVILLDIEHTDFPFGFNLFECPDPKNDLSVQYTVNQVMNIFDRLYEINRGTPQMSYYIRNCAYTIIANPGYTMAEIPLLLINKEFRTPLLKNVHDSATLRFDAIPKVVY